MEAKIREIDEKMEFLLQQLEKLEVERKRLLNRKQIINLQRAKEDILKYHPYNRKK